MKTDSGALCHSRRKFHSKSSYYITDIFWPLYIFSFVLSSWRVAKFMYEWGQKNLSANIFNSEPYLVVGMGGIPGTRLCKKLVEQSFHQQLWASTLGSPQDRAGAAALRSYKAQEIWWRPYALGFLLDSPIQHECINHSGINYNLYSSPYVAIIYKNVCWNFLWSLLI